MARPVRVRSVFHGVEFLESRRLLSGVQAPSEVAALGLPDRAEVEVAGTDPADRGMWPLATPAPGQSLIVRFRDGLDSPEVAAALNRLSAYVADVFRDGAALVTLGHGVDVEVAAAGLRARDGVVYAEPNARLERAAVSTDPYFTNGSLWGMYGNASSPANPYGSEAAEAWAAGYTGSSSVYIGVIDEGVQTNHPDLQGQVWVNPYDPVDGVDNDGNGYTDDTNGWDFAGNNNTVYDGGNRGREDDHGTHVAGTIGAKSNGSGVVGVSWNVRLISGKFLTSRGGSIANAIKAVDYFTDLKARHGLNIVATNNSWGGGGYSQGLYDAIARANAAGILFVAAAGNNGSNNDATASYPSSYDLPNIISVAAITSTGGLASYSNYGATRVDLGAPGSGVWSTTAFNTYSSYSGTSMATPHVTGAVALYAAANPGASASQIKTAILGSATPTPSLVGKTLTGGRLNITGALGI